MHNFGFCGAGYSQAAMVMQAFLWLLLIAGIIAGTLFILRFSGPGRKSGGGRSALEILDQRYAEGLIDQDDYVMRKRDIMNDQRQSGDAQQDS